jgi:hypothetical protein
MSSKSSLADLDELAIRCRSDEATDHIDEAVRCYKAGAYRSCIVATWIAVAYDYIDKLRELEIAGDKNASAKLQQFEKAHQAHNVDQALKLERNILDVARDEFDLLSALEQEDLERLLEDRHRCAHPSLEHSGESFQATAELARVHLRNAVDHFLAHPPVQGKAALERVVKVVESQYFPEDTSEAVERLQDGPLGAARDSLVRNVLIVLIKHIFWENLSRSDLNRYYAALEGVIEMEREGAEKVLDDRLSSILQKVDHDEWKRVLGFLFRIPVAWESMTDSQQDITKRFVREFDIGEEAWVVHRALSIEPLAETAEARVDELDVSHLGFFIEEKPHEVYLDEVPQRLAASTSYLETKSLRAPVRKAAPHFELNHFRESLEAYSENDQVYNSIFSSGILWSLFEHSPPYGDELEERWREVFERLDSEDRADDLRAKMIERYPDLVEVSGKVRAEAEA